MNYSCCRICAVTTLENEQMEKLSGLVLDMYDDREGSVLRAAFPTLKDVPESVKVAMRLEPEQLATLPDDVFALILHDGDVHMRKFACIDEGNTRMHIEYFLKTAHKLPVEAQKTAAQNLCTACEWYGIEPDERLLKLSEVPGLDQYGIEQGKMDPYALGAIAAPLVGTTISQLSALSNSAPVHIGGKLLGMGTRVAVPMALGAHEASTLGENPVEGALRGGAGSIIGGKTTGTIGGLIGMPAGLTMPASRIVGSVGSGLGYSLAMKGLRERAAERQAEEQKTAEIPSGYDLAAAALPVASLVPAAMGKSKSNVQLIHALANAGGGTLLGGVEGYQAGDALGGAFNGLVGSQLGRLGGGAIGQFSGGALGGTHGETVGGIAGQALGSGFGYRSAMQGHRKARARLAGDAAAPADKVASQKDLQKLAIGVMTALNVGGAALAVPGTVEASKKNLAIAHQSQGMVNPNVTRGAYEG
jgi:hypothetical protein